MNDKLDLSIIEQNRRLNQAKHEITNYENLTHGEIAGLHVEIAQLEFSIKTLNFIKS